MAPTNFSSIFIFIFFLIAFFTSTATKPAPPSSSLSSSPSTAVTYGALFNTRKHEHFMATLEPLKENSARLIARLESLRYRFNSVRLINSDPDIIRCFSHSSHNLHLTIPNSLLPSIASNQSEALEWINRHVTPFHPTVHITLISVGDNQSDSNTSKILLNAMINTRQALNELGMHKIKVSTTFSYFGIMSADSFKESVAESLIKPVLNFLADTSSSFLINVCDQDYVDPFGVDISTLPLDLKPNVPYQLPRVFDMMIDSVITAMASLGSYKDHVPVIVTETGLPSVEEMEDMDWEQRINAEIYVLGVVVSELPLRTNAVIEISVALNMSQKYRIDFFGPAVHPKADPDMSQQNHIIKIIREMILPFVWKIGALLYLFVACCIFVHRLDAFLRILYP